MHLRENLLSIIASMPPAFDAHAVILAYARAHQREYIEHLHGYRLETYPFQRAHRALGQQIGEICDFLSYTPRPWGNPDSIDIFGQDSGCRAWDKP